MNAFLALQKATLAARQRTGDRRIATSVEAGKFRVVLVERGKRGSATVTPLTAFTSAAEVIAFLDRMGNPE